MAQLSRLRETEISAGNIIVAEDIEAEFDQIITESNSQDTRLTSIESGTLTITGTKTFGTIPILPASDPTTDNQAVRKAYVDTTVAATGRHKYNNSAPPVYASTSTFTVAWFDVRNSADDGYISKETSTTVDISTTGINGVAQSADLAGTVSSSGTTVTGTSTTFQTDFQVGDVIVSGAQARRITNITDDDTLTIASAFSPDLSGATYKRGGEAPSTWYYLYAITDNTTPGLILSTRNVAGGDTLVDLPSGYDDYRQLPFAVKNNGDSDFLPWVVGMGWPYRPFIKYMLTGLGNQLTAATTSVLSASNGATTYTDVDCSSFIPPISTMGYFNTIFTRSATATHYVRPDGSSADEEGFVTSNDSSIVQRSYFMPTSSSQVIEYKAGTSNTFSGITVAGFVVTEV